MIDAAVLAAIVIIPVFIMLFGFAWRYREGGSKKARYSPEFATHKLVETIWWGVPIIIIGILSVLTWTSSHDLDPFKPLVSSKKAITVQVVALQWKWLFLYPEQHVATVNYLVIPTDRPVSFQITSDAPMNSFWIPQLGGQVYAMSGMTTQLQLIANKPGDYYGSSANISGNGFAGMHFMTHAVSDTDFGQWSHKTAAGGTMLSQEEYDALAKPSIDNPIVNYANYDKALFDSIVSKYMSHDHMHMEAD